MPRNFKLPKGLPAEAPHRVVDNLLDSVADSAKGVVGSIIGGLKDAGEGVAVALDKPFKELMGKSGPHRIIDCALDGYADAVQNFVTNGAINSLKMVGGGISNALDHPWEQLK